MKKNLKNTIDYLEIKGIVTYMCGIPCERCKLSRYNNDKNVSCIELEARFPTEAIKIVEKLIEEKI